MKMRLELELSSGLIVEMTEEDAKEIYEKLHEYFGEAPTEEMFAPYWHVDWENIPRYSTEPIYCDTITTTDCGSCGDSPKRDGSGRGFGRRNGYNRR